MGRQLEMSDYSDDEEDSERFLALSNAFAPRGTPPGTPPRTPPHSPVEVVKDLHPELEAAALIDADFGTWARHYANCPSYLPL